MPYDGASAASYADSHAQPDSTGECAKYVRRAIEWGGISLPRTRYAKDYGPILKAAGFRAALGAPRKGDVIVIQPAPGHPAGHMAIYDGAHWISDFKQRHGFYPDPAYRNAQPSYEIYRHD
ncbi:CHAP domain-containing protein [Dyella sp. M7H15-1]|nr:CHAP domain-containing protein [Dyella sp. M7H15-1]